MKKIESTNELLHLLNESIRSNHDITFDLHRITENLRDSELAIFMIAKVAGSRYLDVSIDLATDRVLNNKEFITLMGTEGFGKEAIIASNPEYRNDPDLMLKIIENNFYAITLLGEKILSDKNFILILAETFGDYMLPFLLASSGHCPFVNGPNIKDFKFNDPDIINAVEKGKLQRKSLFSKKYPDQYKKIISN